MKSLSEVDNCVCLLFESCFVAHIGVVSALVLYGHVYLKVVVIA
jgi:hypothetical protein